ncbi:recombinase family protein [Ammoniphilus sp. CFH 90114]|uniref:recombinase family protein n=1 Tax=Ammoniphilus sp. CFH 90114 TaxID=2493665 RepID=UPI0013E983A3|nr:recombinase family protein [Ammoniphilus sp. CFH 90114]
MEKSKALGILRKSSYKQKNNLSFDIQREKILGLPSAQEYDIEFIEEIESAYHSSASERSGMQEVVEKAINGDYNALFFYEESRVSRQSGSDFVIDIVREIARRKPYFKFYSTSKSGEWDPDSLEVKIKMISSESDSRKISQRVIDTRNTLLGNKKRPGGPPPYGYILVEGKLVPVEHEVPIVNFIFFLAIWGTSNKDISNLLNQCNVPTRSNGNWSPSSIDVILNNHTYIGDYTNGKRKSHSNGARKPKDQFEVIKDFNEPIIPQILWNLVVQVRQLKNDFGMKMRTPFLLRGVIECKKCSEILKCKDNTPTGSKNSYLNYYCDKCKNKISPELVHPEFIKKFIQKILTVLTDSKGYTKQMLKQWEKDLKSKSTDLKHKLDIVEYHRSLLDDSNELFEEWKSALQVTMDSFKEQIELNKEELIKVERLMSNKGFTNLFSIITNSNLSMLRQSELRILVLQFTKRVIIDFIDNEQHIELKSLSL